MVTRRVSKMKCKRNFTVKNSKIPPFSANSCAGKKKRGKDGWYISSERADGVWIWKKQK